MLDNFDWNRVIGSTERFNDKKLNETLKNLFKKFKSFKTLYDNKTLNAEDMRNVISPYRPGFTVKDFNSLLNYKEAMLNRNGGFVDDRDIFFYLRGLDPSKYVLKLRPGIFSAFSVPITENIYGSIANSFISDFKKAVALIKNKKAAPYNVLFEITDDNFDDNGLCAIFDHPQKVYNGLTIYELMDNKTPLTKYNLTNVKIYLKRILDYESDCVWIDNSSLNDKQRTELNNLIKGV